ncbi:hypothetical protein [Aliikangiella maris]|uniref:Phage shock protein B n=2 Tax=Aliikangiella maris TaxID=3162458 RepID=A0ABV3MLG4_9GAMM
MFQLFEMIVAIVFISIVASLIREWIKHRQPEPIDLKPLEDRITRLESLEERIKVLEAIVTDKGYDLKSQINNL